jgi:hypothetical protein
MKNVNKIEYNRGCYSCGKKGFFGETPNGADYETCCLCDGYTNNMELLEKKFNLTEDDIDKITDDNKNMMNWNYCDKCHVLSELGCMHSMGGCTDNTYNGHFIAIWKDKKTNEIYEGMPQFDNVEEWFNRVNDIEVIKIVCPNNGIDCSKASYPKIKYPQYYGDKCNLIF